MPLPTALQPPRRTQAERRAATRSALLDATIDCIVEDGYANTTTRRIAERAGVTPGALQHHFATRAELVADALRHLIVKLATELLGQADTAPGSTRARTEQLLDRLWEVHKGPLLMASLELWVAARTDPELRASLIEVQHDVTAWQTALGLHLFPELATRPGFAEIVATGLATMRGLTLIGFASDLDLDAIWHATRTHLLALFLEFPHAEEASS
ncbi:MAG TPA: TetR/AcrR family transcriptional regulator [Solirubrobacteraceae bacterium]|nr:TetR/AcrR family transcriptional regulator [Solirubrobacteraceae bacterium]